MKIDMKKLVFSLLVGLTIVPAFGDEKMDSLETGSEETSMYLGDADEMSGFNREWLDSVPYLLENARLLKPWAFEALGDCYRDGKGGIEKSIPDAIMCYGLANLDIPEKMVSGTAPSSEWDIIDKVMDGLSEKKLSDSEALDLLTAIDAPRSKWAEYLENVLKCEPEKREDYILSTFTSDLTYDEAFLGIGYLTIGEYGHSLDNLLENPVENLEMLRYMSEKLRPLKNTISNYLWRKSSLYAESEDTYVPIAIEFSYAADRLGYLSKSSILQMLFYFEEHGNDKNTLFSEEDLLRFRSMFSPEELSSLREVEMYEIVEMEDDPVMLIEELEEGEE